MNYRASMFFAALLVLSVISSASAQSKTPRLGVLPSLSLQVTSIAEPATQSAGPRVGPSLIQDDVTTRREAAAKVDLEVARRHLQRSRSMIAVGAGIIAGGVLATGMGSRSRSLCYQVPPRRNRGGMAAGAALIATGLTLTIRGTFRLTREDRSISRPRAALPFYGALGLLASIPIWLGAGFADAEWCISS